MKNGWVDGGQEEDIADVKLDSTHYIVSLKQDWICDVLAYNLNIVCVCVRVRALFKA